MHGPVVPEGWSYDGFGMSEDAMHMHMARVLVQVIACLRSKYESSYRIGGPRGEPRFEGLFCNRGSPADLQSIWVLQLYF